MRLVVQRQAIAATIHAKRTSTAAIQGFVGVEIKTQTFTIGCEVRVCICLLVFDGLVTQFFRRQQFALIKILQLKWRFAYLYA